MIESEAKMTSEILKPTVEVVGLFGDLVECHGKISSTYNLEQANQVGERLANEFTVKAEGTGCVCIDGRKCKCLANGEVTKPMSKVAGGNGLMVFAGIELADVNLNKSFAGLNPDEKMKALFKYMAEQCDEEVHCHSSTLADDRETNECGAAMSFLMALDIVNKQIGKVGPILKSLLSEDYEEEMLTSLADKAGQLRIHLEEAGYVGTMVSDAVYETQGQDHVEKLESDQTPTHGHNEELVILDLRSGVTIDRDAINDDPTMPQVFAIDVDAIQARAERYSASQEEYLMLYHAMLAMQVATYATLCDGSHPVVVIK